MLPFAPIAVILLLALTGCRTADIPPRPGRTSVAVGPAPTANQVRSCVDGYQPGVDYFPHKVQVEHARQFSVSYHGHYKRLRFHPSVASQETEEYWLVQCGAPVPAHPRGVRVVSVPAQRFVLTNLAFIGAAVRLGLGDELIGISSINGVSHPEILRRYEQGRIKEVGSGPHSSVEMAIATDTDLLFTFYSAWPNYNTHPKLWDVGIQGIPTADHFESTPLGRSEWLKFLALFFNREQEANAIFTPAAERYARMAGLTTSVNQRPQVLVGWPSGRDIWNLHGAKNFFARLIWDAGGEYFWHDNQALSLMPVNFERVYDQQEPARFYVSRSFTASTRKELARLNPLISTFQSYAANGIWSPDKNTKVHRRTPWQDQSLDQPDVVLADFIRMLHPEKLPDHDPAYLRKVD